MLNTLDSNDETPKNQMISRLLLALTNINDHEAIPTAALSLGEMESIAEGLVEDRRLSQCDAVRVAFIEMKRRHDKIFRNYRQKITKVFQQEARNLVGNEAKNTSVEKRNSNGISNAELNNQQTIDAMKGEYEAVIRNMTRIHSEKILQLEKELEQRDLERQQMLESFQRVSAQAFGLWRKNHL
jgi:hypothetical protein